MIFNIVPEKPIKEVDLNNASESLKFFLNGNKDSNLSTSSPYMKAILYTFSENLNNPLSFEKITAEANKMRETPPQIQTRFLKASKTSKRVKIKKVRKSALTAALN
jgi:methyltransferase-like protein